MAEPVFKPRGGPQFRKKRAERDDSSEEPEAGEAGGELDETAAAIERLRKSQTERAAPTAMKKALMKKKLKEEIALQVDDSDEMVVRMREAEQFDPAKWYSVNTRKSRLSTPLCRCSRCLLRLTPPRETISRSRCFLGIRC